MFHKEINWPCNGSEKSKKHKIKKSESHHDSMSKHPKHVKTGKHQRHNKHSRLRHTDTVSDFLGPDRLTKHVGIFSKGKISNSIKRIEEIMPKEVKARVKDDLKEVLKLTCSGKNKQKIFDTVRENLSSKEKSFCCSLSSPQYLYHKTGFANSSWKDKLQRSVGLTANNSVLDSVHEPVHKSSPIEKPLLIMRDLMLNRIHPFIKQTNSLLFPSISNKDKLKRKLLLIKHQLCANANTVSTSCSSSIPESSQISQTVEINNFSQNTVSEDFCLNPIYTGDTIGESNIKNMFPSVNEFSCNSNVQDTDFVNLTNDTSDCEIIDIKEPSHCIRTSSVTFKHSSPTTSNDSPAWKLNISPVKFVPELGSTPTLYFRHKMF